MMGDYSDTWPMKVLCAKRKEEQGGDFRDKEEETHLQW